MLFYSFFKSLVGKDVVVELKNDLSICGTLHSVDQVRRKGPYIRFLEGNMNMRDGREELEGEARYLGPDFSVNGVSLSLIQYLNIKLTDISVTDPEKYPHMLSVKNCFIRGSVVRYVQLPADEVDTQLLQDAARKEAMQQKQ
uniref:LSM2 homolog, U6 small nuclear RNA and mRNA degradation associated n=1 Tax=Vombatus ursinus TaxID=29139 RepID=A0A4X2K0W5_VOMUR